MQLHLDSDAVKRLAYISISVGGRLYLLFSVSIMFHYEPTQHFYSSAYVQRSVDENGRQRNYFPMPCPNPRYPYSIQYAFDPSKFGTAYSLFSDEKVCVASMLQTTALKKLIVDVNLDGLKAFAASGRKIQYNVNVLHMALDLHLEAVAQLDDSIPALETVTDYRESTLKTLAASVLAKSDMKFLPMYATLVQVKLAVKIANSKQILDLLMQSYNQEATMRDERTGEFVLEKLVEVYEKAHYEMDNGEEIAKNKKITTHMLELVDLFLDAGANPTKPTSRGQELLDITSGERDLFYIIQDAICDIYENEITE